MAECSGGAAGDSSDWRQKGYKAEPRRDRTGGGIVTMVTAVHLLHSTASGPQSSAAPPQPANTRASPTYCAVPPLEELGQARPAGPSA